MKGLGQVTTWSVFTATPHHMPLKQIKYNKPSHCQGIKYIIFIEIGAKIK